MARCGTGEIRVEKSYQFPDRAGAISFSPPTDHSESSRVAATHCALHSSNRADPTQTEQCRTPTHSSIRGKTNTQVTGGAADATRKTVGHFKDKHRWVSRRNRLPAQSYPGSGLFVFLTQRKAAH